MWKLLIKVIVTFLVFSTFSLQRTDGTPHAHSRLRLRSSATGVRGRREGEGTMGLAGGYLSNTQTAAPSPPALYSAPRFSTFESLRAEEQKQQQSQSPTSSVDDSESSEQKLPTTTEYVSTGDAEVRLLEDVTSETGVTQMSTTPTAPEADSTEAAARDGGSETTAPADDTRDDESGFASGRYLAPRAQGRRVPESFFGNDNSLASAQSNGGGYTSNGGGGHYDSSGAFSSYYSSAHRSHRPLDQQQVENFNHQQYTRAQQQQQPQQPYSLPLPQDNPAPSSAHGGYNIQQRNRPNEDQGGPTQQQNQKPNYEQISAVEQSYYESGPTRPYTPRREGGNGNGNGYHHQGNGQQPPQQQQQQQQQQYNSQAYSPLQPQPQFRYIAQQPEQFYPTPAVAPVQQYIPINPLARNGNDQGNMYSSGSAGQEPAHIQNNIVEAIQEQQQRQQQTQKFQQNSDAVALFTPEMNGLGDDDSSMELTFEGLNENIVDAELLQRVQQIIEEHERQEKEILARQRQGQSQEQQQQFHGNQNSYEYSAPGGPGYQSNGDVSLVVERPQPSINYKVDVRPRPQSRGYVQTFQDTVNDISSQALSHPYSTDGVRRSETARGYEHSYGQMSQQQPSAAPRFSEQLQRHPTFGQGNGNGGERTQLEGKRIANAHVQPAILTQHFMETGTATNLHRQNLMHRSNDYQQQQQHQGYMQPGQESSAQNPTSRIAPEFQDPRNPYNKQYNNQAIQSQPAPSPNGLYQQPQNGDHHQQQQQQQPYSAYSPQFRQSPYPQQDVPFTPSEPDSSSQNGNNEQSRGGFTQQFRQEYSRIQQDPYPQEQSQEVDDDAPTYPSYNTNSIDQSSENQEGAYQSQPRPILTKTIVIHERPAPPGYPAELTNRAVITADDLRGVGFTVSMQSPSPQYQTQQHSAQMFPQYMMSPQYEQQYSPSPPEFNAAAQKPSMIYLPMPVPMPMYSQAPSQSTYQPQHHMQSSAISIPKPVYGIPLAPALGPESLASLPPSSYGQPQQQYSNSIENPVSQSHGDSAPQQSIWDQTLHAVYRLPSSEPSSDNGRLTNPVPLVSQVVSLPHPPSPPQTSSNSEESEADSESSPPEPSSSYGARLASRRSVQQQQQRFYGGVIQQQQQ